ncbi:hypothetical protein ACIPR7_18185 [Pectobacterium parvum]|uniref:Uncharacterized protein n=1 Tax=Pectobacterium odoriferum TaxID=78398 RepID=A0ABR4VJZ4_9GAMM|nr:MULTISPECIES: hypothetical protein [Pectobacterium]AZK61351.1 hypothetical protein EIP93_03015 [Pectobacterium versatile]KGA39691.1 hypothetical protein KU75_21170 [Pectobacterium odoriferum]MCU1793493.1 hypothetical protein [Pectobacterium polaris]QQG29327.1 hypothetical protein JFY74_04480 [Pectobacterium carotovorum]
MSLPIINILKEPYVRWNMRLMRPDEIGVIIPDGPGPNVREGLKCNITDPVSAAIYAINEAGTDNGLTIHIENMVKKHGSWARSMPPVTPKDIARYQSHYPNCDLASVSNTIKEVGSVLSEGQYLFHGGFWPTAHGKNAQFVTTRPLSTTLSPNVAFAETLHGGKAYDAGRIDILVLKVKNPCTKIFAFKHKGTNLGHEMEILFASGATLKYIREQYIEDITVGKCLPGSFHTQTKMVPAYIVEVEIS